MRLQEAIVNAPLRTLRTRDLQAHANAAQQAARLVDRGRLTKVAHGYYVAIPDDKPADWRPGLEATAAGIAAASYGTARVILMGVSAARVHHVIPRAIGNAVVAVERQHRPVKLTNGGMLHLVKRNIDQLDAVAVQLETGKALVTTPEQTALDLAKRPGLGGVEDEAWAAVRRLIPILDFDVLRDLAREQRAPAALRLVEEHGG